MPLRCKVSAVQARVCCAEAAEGRQRVASRKMQRACFLHADVEAEARGLSGYHEHVRAAGAARCRARVLFRRSLLFLGEAGQEQHMAVRVFARHGSCGHSSGRAEPADQVQPHAGAAAVQEAAAAVRV